MPYRCKRLTSTVYGTVYSDRAVVRWLHKYIFLYIYLFTAIGLLPGGSGYFTCLFQIVGI